MNENYEFCPYCNNAIDKKDKQCPYCLKSLSGINYSSIEIGNTTNENTTNNPIDGNNGTKKNISGDKLSSLFQIIIDLSNGNWTKKELRAIKILQFICILIFLGLSIAIAIIDLSSKKNLYP